MLTDTKGIFGFQQVVPVIKKSVLDQEGPEFQQTLNDVSKLLTTDAIVAMNKAVQIDQKDPARWPRRSCRRTTCSERPASHDTGRLVPPGRAGLCPVSSSGGSGGSGGSGPAPARPTRGAGRRE